MKKARIMKEVIYKVIFIALIVAFMYIAYTECYGAFIKFATASVNGHYVLESTYRTAVQKMLLNELAGVVKLIGVCCVAYINEIIFA